jgi:hypothetical protein
VVAIAHGDVAADAAAARGEDLFGRSFFVSVGAVAHPEARALRFVMLT